MDKDERLLMQFFDEQRQEIEDRGFSKRVMRRLPQRTRRLSKVWTGACLLACIAVFVRGNGPEAIKQMFGNLLGDTMGAWVSVQSVPLTSLWVLPAGVMVFLALVCYRAAMDEF